MEGSLPWGRFHNKNGEFSFRLYQVTGKWNDVFLVPVKYTVVCCAPALHGCIWPHHVLPLFLMIMRCRSRV